MKHLQFIRCMVCVYVCIELKELILFEISRLFLLKKKKISKTKREFSMNLDLFLKNLKQICNQKCI